MLKRKCTYPWTMMNLGVFNPNKYQALKKSLKLSDKTGANSGVGSFNNEIVQLTTKAIFLLALVPFS